MDHPSLLGFSRSVEGVYKGSIEEVRPSSTYLLHTLTRKTEQHPFVHGSPLLLESVAKPFVGPSIVPTGPRDLGLVTRRYGPRPSKTGRGTPEGEWVVGVPRPEKEEKTEEW